MKVALVHRLRRTAKSPVYLVKSVDALLAFDVRFVVSKDLESGQKTRRLTRTPTAYGATWWRSTVNAAGLVFGCSLRLAKLDVSLPVMMHQHVDDLFKQIRLLWAKEASGNLVNGLFQLRQSVVIFLSMVSEKGQITEIIRSNLPHRTCACVWHSG